MSVRKLASAIAKREGKKSQTRIGDVREILKVLIEICSEECGESVEGMQMLPRTLSLLLSEAEKKAAKSAKAKKEKAR